MLDELHRQTLEAKARADCADKRFELPEQTHTEQSNEERQVYNRAWNDLFYWRMTEPKTVA